MIRFFLVNVTFIILAFEAALPMQQVQQVETLGQRVDYVHRMTNNCVNRTNEAMGLAYNSNTTSIRAHECAVEAERLAHRASERAVEAIQSIEEMRLLRDEASLQVRGSAAQLEREVDRIRAEFAVQLRNEGRAVHIETELAKIHEKQRLGIFEEKERARAQALVDAEKTKWAEVKNLIEDPIFIAKIILATTALALGVCGAYYGVKLLVDYFKRPYVISQTSRSDWIGGKTELQSEEIDDLIFEPRLQKELFDLCLRVKSAKEFHENLPNVLFCGPSGTGKTAFAKALAHWSELDYAIISGSEFAKITDLNRACEELRKLLNWAERSEHGIILFIDEVDSLFPERTIAKMPKFAIDFINTFLSLISDQSQKKLLFVFGTNHPFKIDEAILNRIGTIIEFSLPQKAERVKIFFEYLERSAGEPEKKAVNFDEQILHDLSRYAENLDKFSPREIKFIAQEVVIYARQQAGMITKEDLQAFFDGVHCRHNKAESWKKERDEWVRTVNLAR